MGRSLQPPLAGRSRLPHHSTHGCAGAAAGACAALLAPRAAACMGGQGISPRGCHPSQRLAWSWWDATRFIPLNQPCHVLAGSRFCHSPPLQRAKPGDAGMGGGTWSPSVPAASGTETPVAALLHPHGSPCTAPITPWGTITPALSPAWLWGHTHPVCSRTGALLAASSPRRTPESSSCAASAHPHTHTVPSPCSPGSHVNILLGAAPRHATAPSNPGLPVPCKLLFTAQLHAGAAAHAASE